jgi:hypothetical protein
VSESRRKREEKDILGFGIRFGNEIVNSKV